MLDSLKERAKLAQEAYGSIKGITVNEIQGAMYGFPRIHLPQKAIDEAKVIDSCFVEAQNIHLLLL